MPAQHDASDETRRMVIPADAVPARADRWATDLSGLSRSHVQRLISAGRLTADGTALKARRVKKTYLALVQGSVSAGAGRIEAPVGRDPGRRTRMAVTPGGRPSTTGYRVRERFGGWTLLELDLVTGRTHQIRVHLEAIGHPVAGDPVYGTGTSRRGPAGLDRLFLHSWRLELTSPSSGRLIRAEASLPAELEAVLAALRERQ